MTLIRRAGSVWEAEMTIAGSPTGKLDTIAKVSLIIGPILVVVFNFLLPTNGIEPIDPENSDSFIAALGKDTGIAQVYQLIVLVGLILYTRGIIGLWRIAPEGVARYRLGIGLMGSVAALGFGQSLLVLVWQRRALLTSS
jgi:hypothetical protein